MTDPTAFDDDHMLVHALGGISDPGMVRREEDDDGRVRYSNIMLLAPGQWTDAGSGETLEYPAEAIRRSAENWVDNQVNLYHDPRDPAKNVGHVDTDTITVDNEGRLFADVILHGRTTASEDAIGLMDLALESDGEQGVGGPSVEIPNDETEWDSERGLERMVEMEFSGVGLVQNPASRPVAFEDQLSERAVALADADGDAVDVRVMERETPIGDARPGASNMDDSDPLAKLRALQDELEELERQLADDSTMEAAQDALMQYKNDGNDPSSETLQDFVEWADDNEGVDMDTLSDAIDAFMQSAAADSPDAASAEAFLDWVESQGGSEDEPEEGDDDSEDSDDEDGDNPDEEEAEEMASELDDAMETISKISERFDAIKDMLEEAPTDGEVKELREALDAEREARKDLEAEIDERLKTLEDEPEDPRTLAESTGGDGDGERKPSGSYSRSGQYIGR